MKPSFIKNSLLLAIALVFTIENSNAQKKEKDKVLDKKVFLIDMTEQGKKKAAPDEISFAGNKLKSKMMEEKGFKADAYTVSVDSSSGEKVITFEATLKSDSEEELVWNGTVKEDDIEGTAVISKKGKVKKEYDFSGSLKQKKKK